MFTAEDVIAGAQFIRYYLDELLGEQAAPVRTELDTLLQRAEAGEKVDNLILKLLDRYPKTKKWMREYLLGDRAQLLEQMQAARTSTAATAWDGRVVNAWLRDLAPNAPLRAKQRYHLQFNVGLPRNDSIAMRPFPADRVFQDIAPEVASIEVQIVVESSDFAIEGDKQQVLVVPRIGPSEGIATFTIVPLQDGPGTIVAQLFVRGRKFQELAIRLQVGPLVGSVNFQMQARGLAAQSAFDLPPRPDYAIDLDIAPHGSGYLLKLRAEGVRRAVLDLTETKVAQLIAYARGELRSIVYKEVENVHVYQIPNTEIPADIHAESLRSLAKLGYFLFQELFYAPGNGLDAHAIGAQLRELSQQQHLTISIDAERFVFPWALLYDRDPLDLDRVDPNGFWGFKHRIEYLPQFRVAPVPFSYRIIAADRLALGFLVNTAIDDQLQERGLPPVVASHRAALEQIPALAISEHPTCPDLYQILSASDTPAQILYFYCHAESKLPFDWADVAAVLRQDIAAQAQYPAQPMRLAEGAATLDIDSSKIILSDGPATLRDLKVNAPLHRPLLQQAPLVFVNACQGAELSPYLYDGLVPYLVARGARGVIGAEVDTPVYFAAEFAQALLERFAEGGRSLGDVLLELRREYLTKKQNVLGLIYALYSSGDLVIIRAASGAN